MYGYAVLILIVVEDGLVPILCLCQFIIILTVLILVVVEDGLVQLELVEYKLGMGGLNPCCSGRWPRTLKIKIMATISVGS